MATGPVTRLPKRQPDGTVSLKRTIKDENGNLININEVVVDYDSPAIPNNFAQEIVDLINEGAVSSPNSLGTQHIVNISSQIEHSKLEYDFVDEDGNNKISSNIFRVFLNGINVSKDVELINNGASFRFPEVYVDPGIDETDILIIDYMEEV